MHLGSDTKERGRLLPFKDQTMAYTDSDGTRLKGFPDSELRLASGRRIQMGSKLGEEEIVENRPVHLRHSDVATAQHKAA